MSQSMKVEQSKLTQLDEAIETSVSIVTFLMWATEKLQSDGQIVYTKRDWYTYKAETNVQF